MSRWPKPSLAIRSFLVMVVCASILGVGGSQLYQRFAYDYEREKLSVKIATASVRLSRAMIPAIKSGDMGMIRSIISAFAGTPEVTCVTIKIKKGKVVEHWPDEACVADNPGLFIHKQPIRRQIKVLGEAEVYFTDFFITQNIREFNVIIAGGIASLMAMMLLAMLVQQRLMIQRPISRIIQAFSRLGQGEESLRIGEMRSAPEFEQISGAFDQMAEDLENRGNMLRQQAEELAEKNHEINQSLDYGAMILSGLTGLDQAFATSPFDIAAEQRQLAQIGGDYYAGIDAEDGYIIFFADATGHGVPGALASMLLASAVRNAATRLKAKDGAGKWLSCIHENFIEGLAERTGGEKDIQLGADAILMIVGKASPTVSWASAKQPLFVKQSGQIEMTSSDKTSIGYISESLEFSEQQLELKKKGDMIVMCTDGIFDQPGGEKQFGYGKKRFMRHCESLDTGSISAAKAIDLFFADLEKYAGDNPPLDDRTILAIIRK